MSEYASEVQKFIMNTIYESNLIQYALDDLYGPGAFQVELEYGEGRKINRVIRDRRSSGEGHP